MILTNNTENTVERLDRRMSLPSWVPVISSGSREENFSLETILAQIPPVLSYLPDDTEDGKTCTTTVSSTSSVHRGAASGGSSLWKDSYSLSVASSDLPISRWSHDEEKLLSPLQVCYNMYMYKSISLTLLRS